MEGSISAIVRPWYRQFYLRRGEAVWSSDHVSDDGYASGVEVIDGFVYVGTAMYGSPTEVVVTLRDTDPGPHASAERSADGLLNGDGDLAVLSWQPGDDPVATIPLTTGDLLLRVSWFGTQEAAAHPDAESGGDDQSPERVVVDLWPRPQVPT